MNSNENEGGNAPAEKPAVTIPAAQGEGASQGGGNVTPPTGEPKGYWPDDWRTRMAGEDEKVLNQLKRYGSPEEVWKKARSLEQRLSSGELRSVLPKDAKEEEINRWREENGIPAAPDKYDLKDVGKEVSSDEYVTEFLKAAHASNQTPDQVKASLKSYYAMQDKLAEKRAEEDKSFATKGEDELRSEWGTEYRRNINLIHGLLDGTGSQDMKDSFLHGRLADGTPIGSSPQALKMLLGLALVNNPAATVVPAGGGNLMGSIEDEIKTIEEKIRTNRPAYNRDEKLQARYRELLAGREQLKSREK